MAHTLKYKGVKTRKSHTCYLCGRKFEPGTEMFYWVAVDSGQINTGYYCNTCHQIVSILPYEDIENLFEGGLYELMEKCQTPEQYLEEIKTKNV
jgi:hypothetical protein